MIDGPLALGLLLAAYHDENHEITEITENKERPRSHLAHSGHLKPSTIF